MQLHHNALIHAITINGLKRLLIRSAQSLLTAPTDQTCPLNKEPPIMTNTLHTALTDRFTDADEIKDVANYGCSGGVSGFIYYSECARFFDEYEDEIYDYLNDCGYSMKDFVHSGSTISTLKNDLVWATVEAWCQAQTLVDELETAALA
jgi:hypothetical protein